MSVTRFMLAAAAALVALIASSVVADSHHHLYDLTANDSLTLTAQTRAVAQGVKETVELTAFLGREDAGRAEAGALLERYHRLNRRIRYRVVDPNDAPTVVRTLAIDPSVDVLAGAGGKFVARAPTVTEQDITSVIAQVTRRVNATLCFATGHGENDPAGEGPEGMAAAVRLLSSNGYHVRPVDLLTGSSIPVDCDGLMVAAPTAPLGADATNAIAAYLRKNGRALVLTDPASTVDMSSVLARYRLSVDRGIAFEPSADAHLPDDPATIIVRGYHSTNPVVRGLPPTVYPGAGAIVLGELTNASGLSTVSLVETGNSGFLERNPQHRGFTKGEDRIGPVTIVGAADRSRVLNVHAIERSRVVVAADVDFATNAFIAEGGNARLLVQSVDWLTTQEDLVPLNANLPPYRPLALTAGRTTSARVLSVGVIPGAFLAAGLVVWLLRRRA